MKCPFSPSVCISLGSCANASPGGAATAGAAQHLAWARPKSRPHSRPGPQWLAKGLHATDCWLPWPQESPQSPLGAARATPSVPEDSERAGLQKATAAPTTGNMPIKAQGFHQRPLQASAPLPLEPWDSRLQRDGNETRGPIAVWPWWLKQMKNATW